MTDMNQPEIKLTAPKKRRKKKKIDGRSIEGKQLKAAKEKAESEQRYVKPLHVNSSSLSEAETAQQARAHSTAVVKEKKLRDNATLANKAREDLKEFAPKISDDHPMIDSLKESQNKKIHEFIPEIKIEKGEESTKVTFILDNKSFSAEVAIPTRYWFLMFYSTAARELARG
jgi:hypothetical protein